LLQPKKIKNQTKTRTHTEMKNQTTPIQRRKNQAQRGQSSQTIAGGFIEHILKPSNQQSYVSLVSLVIN